MFCTNRVPRRSKLSSRPAKRGTGHRWPPAAVAQRTRRQASLCLRSRTVEGARAATLAPPVQEEPPHAPSTALRGGKIRSFSRRARVRALPTTTTPFPHRDSAPRKKGGSGAPKGACQPLPRRCRQVCRNGHRSSAARPRASQTSVRNLRTHLLPGRARLPALRPRLLSETVTSPTQLQAMLPGTRTVRDPDKARPRT